MSRPQFIGNNPTKPEFQRFFSYASKMNYKIFILCVLNYSFLPAIYKSQATLESSMSRIDAGVLYLGKVSMNDFCNIESLPT